MLLQATAKYSASCYQDIKRGKRCKLLKLPTTMMVTLRLKRRVCGPDAFLSWLRKKKVWLEGMYNGTIGGN